MITLNRADLDFLLRQVTINYLAPDPNNPGQFVQTNVFNYSALANAVDPSGLREVSGANNNLVGGYWDPDANGGQGAWVPGPNTTWGQDSQPFLNESVGQPVSSAPESAYNMPGAAVSDVDPRLISNLVASMVTGGAPLTLANGSFETPSLTSDGGGPVQEDPLGNYTLGAPTGWTLTGTGGAYAPAWWITQATGHQGGNVAWLNGGASLSQVTGQALSAGANYKLTLNVGDRTDQAFGGGTVYIYAHESNTLLGTAVIASPAEQGGWSNVTLDTGDIAAALAGEHLRIEVLNTGGSQILVDDVALTSNTPIGNPAAAAATTNGGTGAQFEGLTFNDLQTAFVANAGVLGGGRYNEWFVSFGQFFDHGLDFVNRDPNSSATITVNLSPLDPLYDADGADNDPTTTFDNVTSIQIRRALVANASDAGADNTFGTADDAYHSVGADGVSGTADDIYSKPQYINQTGLLIDQSQTYGSHQSVNALIREYDATGHPTGRVVSGHTAVLDTPDTADDTAAVGLATWADIKTNALRIGISPSDINDLDNAPVLRVDPAGKLLFTPDGGPAWTSDSVVIGPQAADDPFMRNADGTVMRTGQNMLIDFNPGQSLDSHIITGDGRANENIGLTAVHHVFHEEHNGQVVNIKASLLKEALLANDLTVLNGAVGDPSGGWSTTSIASFAAITGVAGLAGDAAAIDAFFADAAAVSTALASISWNGERLYQAARVITESEYNHIAIDQYVGTLYGALPEFVSYSSDINMGVSLEFSQAVFRLGHSMLTETFNVTDPNTGQDLKLLDMFLNPALYQEIGPTALAQGLTSTLGNEVDEFVTPALQQSLLGQPLDLATINIARGRDVNLPTWNEFREQVYNQLIQNTNNTNGSALAPYANWADVIDHLKNPLTGVNLIAAYARDTGTFDWGIDEARANYVAGTGSLDDIRAAAQTVYDAYLDAGDPNHAAAVEFMQGVPTYDTNTSQWSFAGADQGFWDIDLWIGGLAERPLFDGPLGTTFSYVILDFAQRQQDGDRFYYLYRTPMGTHLGNEIIENQFGNLVMEHTGLDHLNGEIFIWANETYNLTESADYFNVANETILDVDGTPMPASAGHVIISGYGGDDYIVAGLGDDTIYGDAGNDQIYGSQGNDHLFGGDGDDYIYDDENDDFITGGAGNDRIFAGPGAIDTVFGDEGDDEIHGGDGIDELLGGTGDDMIYGDGDTDVLFGEEGNDYLEGGDSVDEMQGQEGNDWLRGGVGDDHLMGGDGNDLLEGGVGPTANDGDRMLGQGVLDFSLANPPDLGFDVVSYEDVDIPITADLNTSNENGTGGLLDTYAGIEGLVGTRFNDNLTGADTGTTTSNGIDNLLVGGGGDDDLIGLGGDDVLVGDSVAVRNDLSVDSGYVSTVANWKGTGDDRPVYAANDLGHFLGETGAAGTDTAVFRGNLADYSFAVVTYHGYNAIQVTDTRDPTTTIDPLTGENTHDGTDILIDMEFAQFADQTISVVPSPPALDLDAPFSGNVRDQFGSQSYNNNNGSVNWAGSWTENDTGGAFGGDINITGGRLHFGESTDGGETIARSLNLAGATSATLTFDYEEDDRDLGENTVVQAWNSTTNSWDTVGTILGSAANGTGSFSVALTAAQMSANSAIRFVSLGNWSNGENFYIDNVNITFSTPGTAGNDYATTFTEDGGAVAIAAKTTITDDSATMKSAKIVLTNAKLGDTLTEHGINGDGITGSIDTTIPGQITLTLTGTASLAAYQNAIQAVTFSNSSQNPDPADRIITVTVNDGLWTSNVATSTIHVVPQNDAPNAANDAIIVNVGASDSSVLVLPELVLTRNDTDPENSVLHVTATSGLNDLASVSLGSGLLTITNNAQPGPGNDSDWGSFNYTLSDGNLTDTGSASIAIDTSGGSIDGNNSANVLYNALSSGTTLNGNGNNDVLFGNVGNDTLVGGTGNDVVLAGGGNDSIVWNANTGTTDGHDFVDGGAGTDTFTINGNNSAETYRVYARADAIAAGITDINADTEIVITRNGTNNASVIAELDNVEEIQINTSGGADTVLAIGNFSPTSLNYSTITINGENGDDTVDITGLTSDHRIVFHGGRGDNHVIGDLRPQDVIENPDGHSGASASIDQANHPIIGNVREGDTDWRHTGEDALDYSAISASIAAVRGGGSFNCTVPSAADRGAIASFQPGDRIDLSAMDSGGEHSFVLFAGNLFNSAGQMIIDRDMQSGPEHTLISAGINGCTPADFKDDSGAGGHASPVGDFNPVH
jgi:Ca2+-binding RTX toxin-like protein